MYKFRSAKIRIEFAGITIQFVIFIVRDCCCFLCSEFEAISCIRRVHFCSMNLFSPVFFAFQPRKRTVAKPLWSPAIPLNRKFAPRRSGFHQNHPIAFLAIIHPCSLHVVGGREFHVSRPFSTAKIPHGLYVLMFGQGFRDEIAITSDNIHDATG